MNYAEQAQPQHKSEPAEHLDLRANFIPTENGKQETGSIAHRIPSILGPITKVPEAIRVCLSSPSLVVDRAQEILEAII